MRLTKVFGRLAVLVLVQQLAACGGGGGGGSTTPPPAAPPPPPIISAQSFAGTEDADTSAALVLRPAAGDTVTVAVTTAPTRGTLTAFTPSGTFTYRPNANLNGADTFTVEATDSRNNKLSAVITVNVAGVNDAPVATGEIVEVAVAPTVSVNVLANDTDIDDTALTVIVPAAPAGAAEANPAVGTATVDASNRVQLALPAGFRGVTRFKYQVRDAAAATSAEVTAVVFVGTPQFDVWYSAPSATNSSQLFVTDLLGSRQVTQFVLPRKLNGTQFSANGTVALMTENDGDQLRDLWTVGTRAVEAPVRMTPGHDATQTLDQHTISPDGAWVAYVVQSAGVKQLWLVERANPAGRRQIPLRAGHEIYGFWNMKFAPNSRSLFFLTQSAPYTNHLNRVNVADPANPTAVFPLEGQFDWFSEWFLAPDSNYLIVRSYDILRIPLADPTIRIRMNDTVPSGQFIGNVITDASATRFVYLTVETNDNIHTDDRLWMCDADTPGNSTLILDADPTRTGPASPFSIRPDQNAVLIYSTVSVQGNNYSDLAELSLELPDRVLRQITPPRPQNSTVGFTGEYLDSDTIMYSMLESQKPWHLYEAHRGSFGAPTELVDAGAFETYLRYSSDKAVFATTHSRNIPGDTGYYGILVNRAAPRQMLRVTPPGFGFAFSGSSIVGIVERD